MLVEDEDSVRKIVRLSLEKQNCQVIECSSPEQALAIVEPTTQIDLLVTDVVMPNLRGPELAQALRSVLPSLRVLYMSGYADESIGLKHALRSCDDFLQNLSALANSSDEYRDYCRLSQRSRRRRAAVPSRSAPSSQRHYRPVVLAACLPTLPGDMSPLPTQSGERPSSS